MKLRDIVANYQKPPSGKNALLLPFKEEILALKKKGATHAEVATYLTDCKILEKGKFAGDNISKFLAQIKHMRRIPRAKVAKSVKSASA
jgi:hypothetical protein